MTYWVKRILLKSGEVVTEHELRHDDNLFHGACEAGRDDRAGAGDNSNRDCRAEGSLRGRSARMMPDVVGRLFRPRRRTRYSDSRKHSEVGPHSDERHGGDGGCGRAREAAKLASGVRRYRRR